MTNTQMPSVPEIISGLARAIWKKMEYEGDPPQVPTLRDIQEFTSVPECPIEHVSVLRWGHLYFVQNVLTLRFSEINKDMEDQTLFIFTQEDFPEILDNEEWKTKWIEGLLDETRDDLKGWLEMQLEDPGWSHLKKATDFNAVSDYILRTAGEPTQEGAQWLHQAWKTARAEEAELVHPLAPIVRAWIQEKTARHITKEYDEKYPAAIIKHPLGSVREIAFSTEGIGTTREFATPESVNQLSLPLIEPESIIPDVVPITFIDINGKPMDVLQRTKSGAVAHSIRILFEVIMALRTGDKAPIISIPLGDIIHYLNPDKKFHRPTQLKYIIDGINLLDRAAVPWYDTELKKERLWKFLSVTTPIKHEDSNDTRVFFGVSIPPDTHQGYMIQKEIHRRMGKESAARFHAYHTVCYLWDKYGTHRGKLIDPTKPIEARNERGELIHPVTKDLLLTERGKPMRNLYDSQAVKQLPRTDSPEAINRYPLLSNEDLIKACYPNGYTQTSRRVILKRSKAHWEALEKDGYIVIHREQNGWRILPSDNHLSTHRAVVETQKRNV